MKNNRLQSSNSDPLYNELTYGLLKTSEPIEVANDTAVRTVKFTLNGNMDYYVWSINGIPLGQKPTLKLIKASEFASS